MRIAAVNYLTDDYNCLVRGIDTNSSEIKLDMSGVCFVNSPNSWTKTNKQNVSVVYEQTYWHWATFINGTIYNTSWRDNNDSDGVFLRTVGDAKFFLKRKFKDSLK